LGAAEGEEAIGDGGPSSGAGAGEALLFLLCEEGGVGGEFTEGGEDVGGAVGIDEEGGATRGFGNAAAVGGDDGES